MAYSRRHFCAVSGLVACSSLICSCNNITPGTSTIAEDEPPKTGLAPLVNKWRHPRQRQTNPWLLLRLSRGRNRLFAEHALRQMAAENWNAAIKRQLGQSLEPAQLAYLFLLGSDLPNYRFSSPQIRSPLHETNNKHGADWLLRQLLVMLEPHSPNATTLNATKRAIDRDNRSYGRTFEEDFYWGDQEMIAKVDTKPELKRLLLCLAALALQSLDRNQCELMVRCGVLEILKEVVAEAPVHFPQFSPLIRLTVLKVLAEIIGNNPQQVSRFVNSGWFRILHDLRLEDRFEYNLLISKIGRNILQHFHLCKGDSLYQDGIYCFNDDSLFKQHSDTYSADVVFVHGLWGGVWYSWRQRDTPLNEFHGLRFKKRSPMKPAETARSRCWPKDWLHVDLLPSTARLLAVDYDSFVSEWGRGGSSAQDRWPIGAQATALRRKLLRAGVGRQGRPIIWVTHSMGGIIVKQMLCDAKEEIDECERSLLSQSVGCVFLSVPHGGSPLASSTVDGRFRRLLLPSSEVKQMTHNSPYLLTLNYKFREIVRDHRIEVLNVGEAKPSVLKVARWNYKSHVVPQESAYPGYGRYYGVADTHLNTCKPDSRDSPIYRLIFYFIANLLRT